MSWEYTNIGGIGSKEDLENRIKAAKTESEWKNAGKKAGIQIWRIENFGVKAWPPERYGEFYSGDCFIVLETYGHEKALRWNVFFWIGKDSTVDERGTAALKTIELDDLLGMFPVQFRECEGHESPDFLKLFPHGIRCLAGGIDSGFKKVTNEFHPRLLQIKGRRFVRCVEVPLKAESMNTGDVFILDAGEKIYIWQPKKANPNEKFKASQVANDIKNTKRGKAEEVRLTEEGSEAFWAIIEGGKDQVKSDSDVQSDKDFDEEAKGGSKKIMYQLSDESGKMEFKKVQEVGKKNYLSKKLLCDDDVMIIDDGVGIIVWVGKGANAAERSQAILYATNYLGFSKKPAWTRITRIESGREGEKFKEMFI